MRKKLLTLMAVAAVALTANAGGLMTNTNYHVAFDRMMARGASTEIDAAYSNPAGLAWGYDGFQLSLDFQKPWQNRDIEVNGTTYNGKASAPIVPALFASYKKDRWAVSTMIGIVGSGGFVKYDKGVPMFNVPIAAIVNAKPTELDSKMEGKQYIYGGQLNLTYKIIDCLSAAVGFRANYYDGYYKGHVWGVGTTGPNINNVPTIQLDLDCNQKGWGFAPIVGLNFHEGPLTVAARYEFRTKIETENTTNLLSADLGTSLKQMMATTPEGQAKLQAIGQTMGTYTAPYQDGVKTRYDMPALLSLAIGYEITPRLRATAEYHFFDDKFLLGAEYDINDKFTVSLGGQRTDYGLSDGYQQDTSFACDSYSIGLGGAYNVNEKIRLNVGYFVTLYSDYTKASSYGQETFSRTNNVIGAGIDIKF